MDNTEMLEWLISTKKMSIRSAKDVISRKGRILRMLRIEKIDATTLEKLLVCEQFIESSMFIKSQLKRTVTLYIEYKDTIGVM